MSKENKTTFHTLLLSDEDKDRLVKLTNSVREKIIATEKVEEMAFVIRLLIESFEESMKCVIPFKNRYTEPVFNYQETFMQSEDRLDKEELFADSKTFIEIEKKRNTWNSQMKNISIENIYDYNDISKVESFGINWSASSTIEVKEAETFISNLKKTIEFTNHLNQQLKKIREAE